MVVMTGLLVWTGKTKKEDDSCPEILQGQPRGRHIAVILSIAEGRARISGEIIEN